MDRGRLQILTGLLASLSIAGLAVMFGAALSPSERARQSRPSLDVSNLEPGTFLLRPFADGSTTAVLLIKKWSGEFRAFLVPVEDGKVLMPDVHWWRSSGYACRQFRPDLDERGRLLRDGAIRCHDPETPQWWQQQWRWDYDGKPSGGQYVGAMDAMKVEVEGGTAWVYL